MGMVRQKSLARLVALGVPLIAAAAAVVALAWGTVGPGTVSAQDSGELGLRLEGDGVTCDSADNPTECQMDLGTSFTLAVDVVSFPAPSYISVQTYIDYGQLVYQPTDQADPEIVWPDANGFQLRGQTCPTCVNHGATTAMVPPFPESMFVGTVVQLSMSCSTAYSANDLKLIPSGEAPGNTDGALFIGPDNTQVVPVVDSVSVTCGEAPPSQEQPGKTPTALPPTGTGGSVGPLSGSDNGGVSAGVWAAIAAAIAAGVAGAGVFAWRRVR